MLVATQSDDAGGRFAVLRTEPDRTTVTDTFSRSSKRRRRKSAKGDLESTGNSEEPSAQHEAKGLTPGSSSSSAIFAKPPLRAISEAAVLRSNSAEPGSALDATSPETSRQDRQSVPDALQHPRRPHMSLSFQESRPATQGLMHIITAATIRVMLEAAVTHECNFAGCSATSLHLPPQGGTPLSQQSGKHAALCVVWHA